MCYDSLQIVDGKSSAVYMVTLFDKNNMKCAFTEIVWQHSKFYRLHLFDTISSTDKIIQISTDGFWALLRLKIHFVTPHFIFLR